MEEKKLICIGCPLGCYLTAYIENDKVVNVVGNTCPRGKAYAENEVTHPVRTLTTTVRVTGGAENVVSCKTRGDIPKEKILECVKILSKFSVKAPVKINQVLIKNIADTGVDIISTKEIK